MGRWPGIAGIILGFSAMAPLHAACQIGKFAEIPITMSGRRAIVAAQIGGKPARFILDSGAFFSTMSEAGAREYGMHISAIGPGARLRGIGGSTSLSEAYAEKFTIAGQTLPRLGFAIGGSDTGFAGLLGQNLLGFADAEYDLPHGAVRLMRANGCGGGASLAYWADARPVTIIPIEEMDRNRHTIGTVLVNGVKMRATFDTGAEGSVISLAAAKRAGITPQSPGVQSTGYSYGLGQGRARAWRARFDKIDFGGELINHPWIEIEDDDLVGTDMLIGIDFFLTHRVYVDNRSHRMFVTYEGGSLFGLDIKGAVDDKGAALDLKDHAAEPTDAAGYSRRGATLASNHQLEAALADFDKAVAMAPKDPQYVLQRGLAHLANRQPLLGAADIDAALALAPDDAEARIARARLRLGARDPKGTLEDLKAADATLAPSADARLRLAMMYDAVEAYVSAIPSYDLWLKFHPEDHSRAPALNGRCWARALLNRDLDRALSDCDAALRLRPGEGAYLDSRALVRLRLGQLDKAQADYDAAIAKLPNNALALYARGLIERRTGSIAQADADRAAALKINAHVDERAKKLGLE